MPFPFRQSCNPCRSNVFPADDVGEELVFGNLFVRIQFGADADADARRANHRNARIHERQRAAANARHGGRAVGFHDLAGDAMV